MLPHGAPRDTGQLLKMEPRRSFKEVKPTEPREYDSHSDPNPLRMGVVVPDLD